MPLDFVWRLLLSAALGAALGFEREWSEDRRGGGEEGPKSEDGKKV